MKTLKESLNESIVKEAKTKIVITYDYENPDNLYIVSDPSLDTLEQLRNADWISEELSPKGGLLYIDWNDEKIQWNEDRNLNTFKKNLITTAKQSLDEYKYGMDDEVEEVDNIVMYVNPMMPRKEYEKDIWGYFEEIIKNSYVDGDSSKCRALIDLKKLSIILCGQGEISFLNDAEARKIIFGI